jgi:PKD repeat protein
LKKTNKALSKLIAIVLVTAILLGAVPTLVPHARANLPAPAFWVVPDESFSTSSTPLYNTFTVTLWGTVPNYTYLYQAWVTFNATMLQVVSVTPTNSSKSMLFAPHTSIFSVNTDNVDGYVEVGETLLGNDYIGAISGETTPKTGSICTITFNMTASPPPGGKLTCQIGADVITPGNSFVLDANFNQFPNLQSGFAAYSYVSAVAAPTPPVALFSYSPTPVIVGQMVTFNGSASYDPSGGTIVSWTWNFGDTGTASGNVVTHAYSSAGSYTVNLTVTSSESLTNSTTEQVTVYASQPANIYVSPALTLNTSIAPSSAFYVNITLNSLSSIGSCTFNLTYDPTVLLFVGFQSNLNPNISIVGNPGSLWLSLAYPGPVIANPAPLITIQFNVEAYGISPLNLTGISLLDPNGNPLAYIESNGLFANIIRDVAVINVVPTLSWVYQGWVDNITVTVANLGNVSETFNVTAWYDTTAIGTVTVTSLAPKAQTTLIIPWDTTGVFTGNYTITGTASLVPYETYFNTTNNVFVDGTVQVFTVIHDVAVTAVSPSMNWAYAGWIVPVNVTVSNLGNVTETFNVTAYYNTSVIGTIYSVTVASDASSVLTFNWDTTGLTEANYTISAYASPVPYEYNLTNNYLADGQVYILTQIRDVAITNVTAQSYWGPWVYKGSPVNVTVTASNLGQVIESFYVAAFCGSTVIGNVSVTNLGPGASQILVFTLNTSGLAPNYSGYTISAQASTVPFEYNTTNNIFVDGNLVVRLIGDVDGNGKVDMKDIAIAAKAFGTQVGQPGYVLAADIDANGKINMVDIAIIAKNFGSHI